MKIAIYIRQYSEENEAILNELFTLLLPSDKVFIEREILSDLNDRSEQFLKAKSFASFSVSMQDAWASWQMPIKTT